MDSSVEDILVSVAKIVGRYLSPLTGGKWPCRAQSDIWICSRKPNNNFSAFGHVDWQEDFCIQCWTWGSILSPSLFGGTPRGPPYLTVITQISFSWKIISWPKHDRWTSTNLIVTLKWYIDTKQRIDLTLLNVHQYYIIFVLTAGSPAVAFSSIVLSSTSTYRLGEQLLTDVYAWRNVKLFRANESRCGVWHTVLL